MIAVTFRSMIMKSALFIVALLASILSLYKGSWLVFALFFNVFPIAFLTAAVATILARDRRFWAGFSVFGAGYFTVSLLLSSGSTLFTTYFLNMISPYSSSVEELEGWTSYPLLTSIGDISESYPPFTGIGHCLFSIWFAIGAGSMSRFVFRLSETQIPSR